ncbi:MAG TPA: glycosyltransferase family 39 protein [Solirubrobacteraceae bacterium]|nr:glycosyltransferase family 39 protein [Solirubrobacteraceae bacterium]
MWPVGAIVLAGTLPRFLTLGVQSYWYNEADTVSLIRHSFGSMLKLIPRLEGNPPLYYLLAWVWSRVFGDGEVGLRSLSALAGSALIGVVYVIVRRMAGHHAGLMAAALTAANPLLFWFSQEARPYILVVLLVAIGFWCFLRVLEEPSPRRLWPWVLLSVLSLATHYFALFAIAPELAWLLLRERSRRGVLIGGGIVVLAGGALLPIALRQRRAGVDTSIVGSFGQRLTELPKQVLVGYSGPVEKPLTAVAALLALYSVYLAVRAVGGEPRRQALIAGLLGVAGLVIVLALAAVGLDYVNTRNLIALTFFAIVVMAIGFAGPAAGARGLAAGACLCALLVADVIGVETNRIYQRDDWRGALRALGPAAGPRVIVVSPGQGYYPVRYYLPRARLMGPPTAVSEIDLVGIAIRPSSGVAPDPPPVPSAAPPAGFQQVAVIRDRMYTVVRYRSAAPVSESIAAVQTRALSPGSSLVFLERPAR